MQAYSIFLKTKLHSKKKRFSHYFHVSSIVTHSLIHSANLWSSDRVPHEFSKSIFSILKKKKKKQAHIKQFYCTLPIYFCIMNHPMLRYSLHNHSPYTSHIPYHDPENCFTQNPLGTARGSPPFIQSLRTECGEKTARWVFNDSRGAQLYPITCKASLAVVVAPFQFHVCPRIILDTGTILRGSI